MSLCPLLRGLLVSRTFHVSIGILFRDGRIGIFLQIGIKPSFPKVWRITAPGRFAMRGYGEAPQPPSVGLIHPLFPTVLSSIFGPEQSSDEPSGIGPSRIDQSLRSLSMLDGSSRPLTRGLCQSKPLLWPVSQSDSGIICARSQGTRFLRQGCREF